MPEMWELLQAQSDAELPYGNDTCPKCNGLLAHHHGSALAPECIYCTEEDCNYVD